MRRKAARALRTEWLKAQREQADTDGHRTKKDSESSEKQQDEQAAPAGSGRHRAAGPACGPGGVAVPESVAGQVVLLAGARGG